VGRVRAILDTNVVVSALLKIGGLEALILDLALSARYDLAVSTALLSEYSEVLQRPRFGLDPRKVAGSLRRIRAAALHVEPRIEVHAARDPDDNMVLECALAGRADYLVTGNTRHFPNEFQGTSIIHPRRFLVLLATHLE